MRLQLERLVLTHRWTLRETDLYNFQVSLQEIDGMRVGGKWFDADGKKPGGQLVLLYLLRRCALLVPHSLRRFVDRYGFCTNRLWSDLPPHELVRAHL